MAETLQIIRDVININANLPFITGLQPGQTFRLIARQINLTETCYLKGRNIELYASSFIASPGAVIDSQGSNGTQGTRGVNGARGVRAGKREGSDGIDGSAGGNGTAGGAVKVISEVMRGLQVDVNGGDGGKGGDGGDGGKGDDEDVKMDQRSPIVVTCPKGGSGGHGGRGGSGGNGGTIRISSVNYINEPSLNVSGGNSREGGKGGGSGLAGKVNWIQSSPQVVKMPEGVDIIRENGFAGHAGENGGANGTAGIEDKHNPSYDEFWSSLASETFAVEWAKYRQAVGEFFFRSYVPGAADRDQYIGRAIDEFKAAIRLNPKQIESSFRLEQIWNNMNPLGLPRNFDVIPNFKEYMANYNNVANLVTTFTSIGNTLLLKSSDLLIFHDIFESQKRQSFIGINEATAELKDSKQDEEDIDAALKEVEKMIDDVKQRIDKAKEQMKKKPLSFGDIVGDVSELAITVSAVMAAVPTGGASLLVLAPDIISLSKTVYDNAAPLIQAMIDDKQTETLTAAQDQYGKVKKDVHDITNASKKVTNLLNLINTIKAGKTPDNSKLMDLVQRGAELAYDHLLKQQELKRAQMKTAALGQQLISEGELLQFHETAIRRTELNEKIIREAGLRVIQAAFSKVDVALDSAFRAQRSIEIYLLKDQTQYVYYDVGHVHPDIEADYIRDPSLLDILTTSYQESFSRLLNPVDMLSTYQTYFKDGPLLKDISRRSFTDPESLDTFRTTFTLTFSVDPALLSSERYSTKIQLIGIAFIGAMGAGNLISCKLEHGALYSERLRNGMVQDTILKARHEIVSATITPLELSGFDIDSSPPLDGTQNSPLWARGIGGRYTITIPQSEFEEHHPNFEGLREIQVWIGYQFME